MRQMGIDGLVMDYQYAVGIFYNEESYELYIPSVDAGAFGTKSVFSLRAHGFIWMQYLDWMWHQAQI